MTMEQALELARMAQGRSIVPYVVRKRFAVAIFDASKESPASDLLAAADLAAANYSRTNHSNPELMGDDEHEAWGALNRAIAKAEGKS